MHKKIILLFSLISIFVVSCKKPPTACMELSETSINIGAPLEMRSCSEHALSLEWYFEGPPGAPENGPASSDIEYTQTFSQAGTYKVKLYAYEEFSFEGEVSISIEEVVVF